MKITKGRLKTIIEEEIKAMKEIVASDSMHGGPPITSGGGSVAQAAAEALGISVDELIRSLAAEYDVDVEISGHSPSDHADDDRATQAYEQSLEDEDADPVGEPPMQQEFKWTRKNYRNP